MLYRALAGIGLIVFTVVGMYLAEQGFRDLQSMRKLQRMVVSPINALVDGPVATEGKVRAYRNTATASFSRVAKNTVTAPYSDKKAVYYRYLLEEEYRDSDGDRRWRTVKDVTDSVDFLLDDGSSDIVVNVSENDKSPVDWSLRRDTYRTIGDYRHSEWLVRPGDQLFIVGSHDNGKINFYMPGYYDPIVSDYNKAYELKEFGTHSVFKMWGGMALLALAVVLLAWLLKQHRILFFLSVLTLVLTVVISHYSFRMMSQDLKGAYENYEAKLKHVEREFRLALSDFDYTFSGYEDLLQYSPEKYPQLPKDVAERLQRLKYNLAVNQYRFKDQAGKFPEMLMAPLMGLSVKKQALMKLDKSASLPIVRLGSVWKALLAVVCFIAWIILTWLAIRWIKVKRMIENLPTVKTSGLAIGLNELKGRVKEIEGVETMKSPLTNSDCMWYTYKVEERRGSGKNSKWVTIEKDEDTQFFLCKDYEGVLTVDPHEADIITKHKKVERRGKYRYTEHTLRYGDKIYALGDTRVADEQTAEANVTPLIMAYDDDQPFILSNYSEEELMLRKAVIGMFTMSVAFSTLQLTAMLGMAANGYFAAHDLLLSALACPLMFILVMFILHYNDLIFLRNRAGRNWRNIEVSLKKRSDLMKSLHTIVKKYMEHERGLLKSVVEWRRLGEKASQDAEKASEFLQAEEKAANEFRTVVEDYPDIKAADMTQQLMTTCTQLENEISLMREAYNDSVEYYNTRIATFPDVLFSRRAGFKRMGLIDYQPIRHQQVNVSLNS